MRQHRANSAGVTPEHIIRRGGRMTKWKGTAASFAPQLAVPFVTLSIFGAALATSVAFSPAAFAASCGDGSAVASGGSCALTDHAGSYDPTINDNKVGSVTVDGGSTVTLTGNGSDIDRGNNGSTRVRLGNLDPSAEGQERLQLGSQNNGMTVPDPITGGSAVISTYDTGSITTSNWGDVTNSSTAIVDNVNGGMYIDARLGTASGTSSKLVVDIGDHGTPDSATNSIVMAAKQTTLTEANSGATVEWASRNEVWSNNARVAAAGSTSKTYDISVPNYAGTFTGFDGASHTVTSAAELQAYNDALKSALSSGSVDYAALGYTSAQAAYDGEFNKAVGFTTETKSWTITINPGDEVTLSRGTNYSLVATGAGSVGKIVSGGQIDQNGFAVMATDGGHIEIEAGGSLSGGGTSLYVRNGGTAVNNGVISSGYFARDGYDTAAGPGNYEDTYFDGQAVSVSGSGSRFENNGIMNVAGYTYDDDGFNQYGIRIEGGATASNSGIINLGVNNNPLSGTLTGADVRGTSTFVNEASGEIYIGRAAQYDVTNPEAVADTSIALSGQGSTAGITIRNNATAVNDGSIVIGSMTQNAVGMMARSGSTGTLVNRGDITINGAANDTPLQNVGILAQNSSASATIGNEGTITLNGVNGVGVKVHSTGSATPTATMTSSSVINVAGGADPTSGTRNYGVWVEGESSGLATALVDGQINLTGVGGIGVHARGMAEVDVSAGAVPNFISGSDQIGFFIYGPDAKINVDASAMNVSTERSTLFRIAEGADLTATGLAITSSGKESVGILGTGAGTEINADGGNFAVSGEGATGVIVEGGATGSMDGASVTLIGANSVGGIADGQKHDLAGAAVGAADATTVLTANAQVNSSVAGATGFVARNGATAKISGQTKLTGANSVGVLAQDNGNVEISNANIDVTGWATKAQRGTDTFTVSNSTMTGSDGVFNVIEGSTATFTADSSILTGNIISDDDSFGDVYLNNGTVLTGMVDPVSMTIDDTSVWNVTANSSLLNLTNGGTINFMAPTGDPSSAASYKTITVDRTYTGNDGLIAFNTALGDDASPTDLLLVQGSTVGSSDVTVTNRGGLGAVTNEGIKIVDVVGSSDGTFTLKGDYTINGSDAVVGGAYAYQLYKGNRSGSETSDWYLRSEMKPDPVDPDPGPGPGPGPDPDPDPVTPDPERMYQSGAPSYEAYPQALLGLNGVSTLQQRVGNRFWAGGGNRVISQGADAITPFAPPEEAGVHVEGNGVWGRIEGAHNNIESRFSTTGTDYNQNVFKMQAGLDGLLTENENGTLIGGVFVQYVHGKTKTKSRFGDGEISTDGYGLGGTLTWYGNEGFYVDAQAHATWYDSDLSSTLANRGLTDGNDGFGYALSIESGKRFAINPEWSVTPQGQLVYSSVDFDDFTDSFGAPVSLDKGDSLQGRLGLTLDHETSWQNGNGMTNRSHVYGIANMYYEFLEGTKVDLAGVSLASEKDRLWGGVGLGGSYNWDDDKYSIYGEGIVNTSLNNFGDSYTLKGNVGFRVKW